MRVSRAAGALPLAVRRSLKKLGSDISAARRRRGITARLVAERAFINPKSLIRVERGDPGVSIGIYATVLFVLGMSERLADLADISHDPLGRSLANEQLPKRVRSSPPLVPERGHGA
jgi:hypothetical protein